MSSIIDHKMLPAMYEFLRASRPFRNWALPPADEVEFGVIRKSDRRGDYRKPRGKHPHSIRLNDRFIGYTRAAVETMAHEMVHLTLAVNGCDDKSDHGPDFMRLAARVCKVHGFDPKEF